MNVLSGKEGNKYISDLFLSNRPFLVSRMCSETAACYCFEIKRSYSKALLKTLYMNSGVYPPKKNIIDYFCRKYIEGLKNADGMVYWKWLKKQSFYLSRWCKDATVFYSDAIAPWLHDLPWTSLLKDKNVLVVHPYEYTINKQYRKRKLLFSNQNVLPDFNLITIKSIQSIAGNHPHKNWIESYNIMCKSISKKDFDIALVGCGSYGLPISNYIKNLGKQVIHIGGGLQILFGIMGNRWENRIEKKRYFNEYWVRPSIKETPKNYKKIEGGCYW